VELTQLLLQLHAETTQQQHANKDAHHQIHVIVTLMQLEFVETTQLLLQLLAETMLKQHVKEDALHLHHNQPHPILTHVTAKL
jgi:hypothetical protein